MKFISRSELDDLIEFEKVFVKTKNAYKLFSQKKTITPPFTVFTIPESKGSVHFKCGYVPGDKYFAIKYSGAFYGNEKLGLSNFLGLFMIFNAITGEVEAVVDDKGYLTDYRTGVAGAIATTMLCRKNSQKIGIIGTGVQARMQLMMLLKVMDIEAVYVWGRNEKSLSKYISEMQEKFKNVEFISCRNAKEVCENADILYTVTYSENPIIKAEWIKKGTHITAVGACEPSMQELDSNILKIANLVCADSVEACAKNGEIHHAIDAELIELNKVKELGNVIEKGYERKHEDITVCDLVGIGFQDAVIASCVMEKYNEK